MNNLKENSKKLNTSNNFIKDPFYDLIENIYDPIYFNIKLPTGEIDFNKQPKSTKKVKQIK